jgi:hypothetical protein
MSQQSSKVLTASGADSEIHHAEDPHHPITPVWARETGDQVLMALTPQAFPPPIGERFPLHVTQSQIGSNVSLSGPLGVKKYFTPFLPKQPTALEELEIVMVTADELLTADFKLREGELKSTEDQMFADDPAPSRLALQELEAQAKRQKQQLETLKRYIESRRQIGDVDGDEVLRMTTEQGYDLFTPAAALSLAHQSAGGKEIRLYCQHPEIEKRSDYALHYYKHVLEVRVHFKELKVSVRIMPSKSLDRVPLDLPLAFIAPAA